MNKSGQLAQICQKCPTDLAIGSDNSTMATMLDLPTFFDRETVA